MFGCLSLRRGSCTAKFRTFYLFLCQQGNHEHQLQRLPGWPRPLGLQATRRKGLWRAPHHLSSECNTHTHTLKLRYPSFCGGHLPGMFTMLSAKSVLTVCVTAIAGFRRQHEQFMACDTPVKATAIFIIELHNRTTTVTDKKKINKIPRQHFRTCVEDDGGSC